MSKLGIPLLAAALLLCMAGPVLADPIMVDSTPPWYEFSFTGAGIMARGGFPVDPLGGSVVPSSAGNSQFAPAPPWTFTAGPTGVDFTVTDAFLYGDSFNVLDFGTSIGHTPPVAATGGGAADNPDVALADPLYSHATFHLDPGAHSITIITDVSPFGSGAAYFRAVTAAPSGVVPEPGSALLFGVAALAVGGYAWRRRTN
jgi:hypothetical protein